MNKNLRIVLGLAISFFCIWFSFKDLAWIDIFDAFRQAKWVWFVPVTVVYFFAHLLRCFRWSCLLSPVKKIKSLELFPLLMMGFLVNNVLPARAGELARAFAASKKTEIATGTVLGSIALERISDLIGLAFVMAVSLLVIPKDKLPLEKVGMFLLLGVVVACCLLIAFQKLQNKITEKTPRLIAKTVIMLKSLVEGFSAIKSPAKLATVALLSIGIWTAEASCLLIASKAFGLNLSFTAANAVLSGIAFGVMIPAAPGYIGTYELFGSEMLKLLGIFPRVSIPFLLAFHFYQMLLCSVLGIPGLVKFGMPSKK